MFCPVYTARYRVEVIGLELRLVTLQRGLACLHIDRGRSETDHEPSTTQKLQPSPSFIATLTTSDTPSFHPSLLFSSSQAKYTHATLSIVFDYGYRGLQPRCFYSLVVPSA